MSRLFRFLRIPKWLLILAIGAVVLQIVGSIFLPSTSVPSSTPQEGYGGVYANLPPSPGQGAPSKPPSKTPNPPPPTDPVNQNVHNGCEIVTSYMSMDPCDAVTKVFDSLFYNPLRDSVKTVQDTSDSVVWKTPAIYDGKTNNDVLSIWRFCLILVDASIAVAVIIAGLKMMLGHQTWYSMITYANAIDLIPRILFAVLAAHFSLHFVEIMIVGNNALCNVFHYDTQFIALLSKTNSTGFVNFLGFFYSALELLLMAEAIARVAVLTVLMVTSPIWLFFWAFPETQPLARLGTAGFLAACFMQALQLLVVDVGGHLMATHVLGSVAAQNSLVNMLSGIAIIYIALQIPGWLSSWVTQTSASMQRTASTVTGAASSTISAVTQFFM